MRSEKDIRLRIDLLESQSSTIAEMLAKAIKDHNKGAFDENSKRLDANRGRAEELLWVLGEKAGQNFLHMPVSSPSGGMTVRQALEKLKHGEIEMAQLSADAQALIRKGALELRGSKA